jgi:hypothetical protein
MGQCAHWADKLGGEPKPCLGLIAFFMVHCSLPQGR